nr:MAG TPA: hypothetical protein [Caudoviricetes sp.]
MVSSGNRRYHPISGLVVVIMNLYQELAIMHGGITI